MQHAQTFVTSHSHPTLPLRRRTAAHLPTHLHHVGGVRLRLRHGTLVGRLLDCVQVLLVLRLPFGGLLRMCRHLHRLCRLRRLRRLGSSLHTKSLRLGGSELGRSSGRVGGGLLQR